MRQTFRHWILRGAAAVSPLILLGSVPAVTTGCERCLEEGARTGRACYTFSCCDPTAVCVTVVKERALGGGYYRYQVCRSGDAATVRNSSTGITAP
jgi:hypothetical protein